MTVNGIRIQTLTEEYFDEAREIENDFLADGKGFCFGCCPYSWCLMPRQSFVSMHRRDEDKCSRYGLATSEEERDDNGHKILGIIKLRLGSTPSNWMQDTMYTIKDNDELYIDLLMVRREARGNGIGWKLLEWAEDQARDVYGVAKLTLGVTKGNRAKNLYTRFGFVEVKSHVYSIVWGVGMPNGRFGASVMEKRLE